MSSKALNQPLPVGSLLLRSLLKRSKAKPELFDTYSELPSTQFTNQFSHIRTAHLEDFHRIVNWPTQLTERVHPCYFHLYAFPQHLKLMLDKQFPFSLLGIVHLRNRIEQQCEIDTQAPFSVSSQYGDIVDHAKGLSFSIKSKVEVDAKVVWQSESWFLVRYPKSNQKKSEISVEIDKDKRVESEKGNSSTNNYKNPHQEYTGSSPWHFSGKTARKYARISGDYNPIHLYGITAKLFGFKQPIAHGMWSKAWCVSAVAEFIQPKVTVEAKFAQPLMLPNRATLHQDKRDHRHVFALSTQDGQFLHLSGYLES